MEAAALRALTIGACSYTSVKSILQKRIEQTALSLEVPEAISRSRKHSWSGLLPQCGCATEDISLKPLGQFICP